MDKPLIQQKQIVTALRLKRLLVFFLLFLLSACQQDENSITVVVASNFEPTLKKIIKNYIKTNPNSPSITIISASSGTLANQILNHAPFDLFLSADRQKPEIIYQRLQLKNPPIIYANGQLALWIPKKSGQNCLQQLSQVKTLAIANPQIAPYGKVAVSILLENNIKIDKTIQTSNIAQAFIYAKDDLTQAAFVPYSLLKAETIGCQQLFSKKKYHRPCYY